jgi:hypothetical protein
MRIDPTTQAYVARRRAEGKTDREIRRCLIGRVSRVQAVGLFVGNGEGRPRCLAT